VIDTVQNAKPEGIGIMADDVLAGLLAGVVSFVVAKRI
jgi:phosphatidylglycerophosphatase A